jgi:aldehyde:ferredoxin oxidoreductase
MAVLSLIRKIAYNDGIGALLSKGCKKASEVVGNGSDYYCIHLKGQDNLDALRALKAWGFGNVASLRGGRHLDGAPTTEFFPDIAPEVGEKLFDVRTAFEPTTYEGKGKLVAWTSHFKSAVDTTGVCYFGTYWGSIEHMDPEDFAEALSAATGREISAEEFLKVGKRNLNIEKAFNTLHRGFTRKDDYPPSIYMKEPIKTGQFKGELITQEGQDQMLDEFYDMNGWDKETSWQHAENLLELSLPEVSTKLKEANKLV